jgi:hypothetical protein
VLHFSLLYYNMEVSVAEKCAFEERAARRLLQRLDNAAWTPKRQRTLSTKYTDDALASITSDEYPYERDNHNASKIIATLRLVQSTKNGLTSSGGQRDRMTEMEMTRNIHRQQYEKEIAYIKQIRAETHEKIMDLTDKFQGVSEKWERQADYMMDTYIAKVEEAMTKREEDFRQNITQTENNEMRQQIWKQKETLDHKKEELVAKLKRAYVSPLYNWAFSKVGNGGIYNYQKAVMHYASEVLANSEESEVCHARVCLYTHTRLTLVHTHTHTHR